MAVTNPETSAGMLIGVRFALARRLGRRGERCWRRLTAWGRLLPDFLIIGAQRAGTTSLYRYLVQHPYIAPALRKEIHFFDNRHHRGLAWYRSRFPTLVERRRTERQGRALITREGSPYYLFHPLAPRRVAAACPQVKVIVLLRNPVDRAYSHYQHARRKGVETLSFGEAIQREPERLAREEEKLIRLGNYRSHPHQHFSYLARGRYLEQLRRWTEHLPREELLVIQSETFRVRSPGYAGAGPGVSGRASDTRLRVVGVPTIPSEAVRGNACPPPKATGGVFRAA